VGHVVDADLRQHLTDMDRVKNCISGEATKPGYGGTPSALTQIDRNTN
jgi:hypothetical protein